LLTAKLVGEHLFFISKSVHVAVLGEIVHRWKERALRLVGRTLPRLLVRSVVANELFVNRVERNFLTLRLLGD